jgi:hypothetical protein
MGSMPSCCRSFVVGRETSLQQDMKTVMPMQVDAPRQGETAIWILQQPDPKGDLIRAIPAQLIQLLLQGQTRSHLQIPRQSTNRNREPE